MKDRGSGETLTFAFLLLSTALPLICGQTARGIEGQSVTVPCSYKVKQSSDITTMCWGRGSCPNSQCNDVLIWTNGHRVTQRSADRYQLNGNIASGKVSLTISQATMSDAGTYCCRIEHKGWFNDEKINVRLFMEKAPTTTPPTTTRRTTPRPTRPPIRKTTTLPTTTETTPMPATSVITTTVLPTYEMFSTLPITPPTTTPATPPTTMPTTPPTTMPTTPARTIATGPTGEETTDTTTFPTHESNTTAQPTAEGSTSPPAVTTPGPTEPLSTALYTTFMDETTTGAQPVSTDPYVICNISHEMIHSHEAFDHHHPGRTLPSEPEDHADENGISDLFSGNTTTVVKKESDLQIHILIIAVSLSVILVVVVSLLILKYRGKERARYLFGLEPNLELVSHAEFPLSDTDAEISQTVTLEADKVEGDKFTS